MKQTGTYLLLKQEDTKCLYEHLPFQPSLWIHALPQPNCQHIPLTMVFHQREEPVSPNLASSPSSPCSPNTLRTQGAQEYLHASLALLYVVPVKRTGLEAVPSIPELWSPLLSAAAYQKRKCLSHLSKTLPWKHHLHVSRLGASGDCTGESELACQEAVASRCL